MTLLQRRIIVFLLLLVFAISAPLLIFYAAGYRYNTRLKRIEQLGLLYITAEPNGTRLLVDGQSYKVDKELIVDDLRAGSYDITLSKDGYYSWSKRLAIQQGQTTFIRDVGLLREAEAQPREIFVEPLTVIAKTPQWMVLSKPGYLFGFNRSSFQVHELPLPLPDPITRWSVDDRAGKVVFAQAGMWHTADLATEAISTLTMPEELDVVRIDAIDGTLFLITPDQIWRWDQRREPELLASHLLTHTIYPDGDRYWLLSRDAGQKRVFLYELPSKNSRPVFVMALPYADDIRIDDVHGRFLTIHDASNKQLHLVDAKTIDPVIATLAGVHTWSWSPDKTELLTATDFELSIQRVDHGKTQEVLTRLSTPILDAAWYADRDYALYVTADGLFAIERDARDKRNVFHLTKNKADIRLFSQTNAGDRLYFGSTNQGSSYVIWELMMR